MPLNLSKALSLSEKQVNVRKNKTIQIGNLDFYLCPKCATHTIRYAKYKFDGGSDQVSDFKNQDDSYKVLVLGSKSILNYSFEREDSIKVAVKRNPVERFLSGLHEFNRRYYKESIDGVLDKLQSSIDENTSLNSIDFWTQTYFYGDPKKFDHIINPNQVSSLIKKVTGVDLGRIHKGQTNVAHTTPTDEQIFRIKEMYANDYDNGYC